MGLEGIMLSDISQTEQRNRYCISLSVGSIKAECTETETRMTANRDWEMVGQRTHFQL